MKKCVEDGYIISVGDGIAGTDISDAEYNEIISAFSNRPQERNGYALMLKDGTFEFEYIELPPEPEPDPDPEEALAILLGGVEV